MERPHGKERVREPKVGRMTGVIDVWAQPVNDAFLAAPWLDSLRRWTGLGRTAPTHAETVAAMDEGGVELALLSGWHGPAGVLIANDDVADAVQRHPDRFRGVAGVDLSRPMQ